MLKAIRAFIALARSKIKEVVFIILNFLRDSATQYAIKIAKKVVAEVQNDPAVLYDEDKRKEAFRRIKEYAALEGREVRDSVVNFAIETVVAYFKLAGWPD